MGITTHKDLIVWQKAMDLVVAVYQLTENYPKSELYGLAAHTHKTAISIPSNIAEGRRRGSRKDFHRFIYIAFGSGAELETQLEIAQRVLKIPHEKFVLVLKLLDEVMRMLNAMTTRLSTSYKLPPTS